MNNNSFTQIQSRRFNPRREFQQRENNRPPSSSLQLPCRWSLCPTMDLVAVGIGNCVDIVISTATDADDNDDGTKIPSIESTKQLLILRLGVSVSVSIHRLQSWRTLLTLASVKLVSCPSFVSGGDDDDADVRRIHCLEDIERECGVSTFLMALKDDDVNSSSSAAAKEEEDDDITNLEEGKGGDKVLKHDNYNNNNNDQRQYDTTMMHKNTKKDTMMSRNVVINGATCLTWSPDGRRFAIGLLDGGVLIRVVEHLDSRGGKGGGGGALSSSSSSSASTSAAVGLGGGVGDDADDDNDGDASHVIRPPPPSSPPHSHVRGVNRQSSSKNTITATTTTTTNTTTLTNTLLNYSTLQPDEHKQKINDDNIGDESCGSIDDYGRGNGGGSIMNNADNNNADDIGRAVTFDNDGGARDQRRQMEMTKRVTRSMTRQYGVEEEKQQQKGGEKMLSADSQLITISKSSLQVITEDDIIQQTMTVEEEDDAKISTTLTILSSTSAPVIGMTWKRLRPSRRRRWRRLRYCTNDDNEEKKFKVGYEQREEDEYKGMVDECEALETWKHASQLLDKGVGYYLPDPHRFANNSGGGGGDDDGVRMMNTSSFRQRLVAEGALDVLCVATTSEIHWYLRGRYRILSVSHGLSTASLMPLSPSSLNVEEHDSRSRSGGNGCVIDLVCSPDLGTLLAVSNVDAHDTNRQTAKLFSTPLLPLKRFELQYLSYAYTSLFSRLWDVKKGIREALMSWRTTLRPLDTKFNDLSKLLCDYGVDGADNNAGDHGSESIRLELLKFILRGRVTIKSTSITSTSAAAATSSSSTSALDQFFTKAQMHDTLLQREAKMIESCASSTEVILRSHVLASIRAIVYEAQELYGVAYSRVSSMDNIDSFIDVKTALCLYKASQSLFLTFNQCLQNVIEARSRVHDLLSWLRGTAAQVRAWGTASDSVQRRNAKALRVSDIVVRRVATFLTLEAKGCDESRRILTECIIGMPLSDFFIKLDESNPTVPTINRRSTAVNLTSSIQSMFRICTVLFDKPRRVLAESIGAIDITFEVQHSLMAAHTRIGAGYFDASTSHDITSSDTSSSGFFLPKTNDVDPVALEEIHFWTVLARSIITANVLELIVIPGCSRFKQDATFYLRAVILMPEGYTVTSIEFYSDDGNSTLSPPTIDENVDINEGRQSLSFLVKCTDTQRTELWLFRYDDVQFRKYDFDKNHSMTTNEVTIRATPSFDDSNYMRFVILGDEMIDDEVGDVIVPKRRIITTTQLTSQNHTQVHVCGSRGTGGVLTLGANACLNIFDLEEDEDEELTIII